MSALDDYLGLVTPQYASSSRFLATLAASLGPFSDVQDAMAALPAAFDLDVAIGVQLDAIGLWVGVSRNIPTPLTGVYFSFDDPLLGFGAGVWKGPFDATSGLTRLDDEDYRLLLRARIAANHWDGTQAGAAKALAYVFSDPASYVFLQDLMDGSYTLNVAGALLPPVKQAILTGGYIPLKPAGMRLAYVNVTSVGGSPLFGFDMNDARIAGFGTGAWGH